MFQRSLWVFGNPARLIVAISIIIGCVLLVGAFSTPVHREPPGSWTSQLVIAQVAARRIDEEAVLWNVTASPLDVRAANWSPDGDTLRLQFNFYRKSGDEILVQFEDTAPLATLTTEQMQFTVYRDGFRPALTPEALEKSLQTAKIGPREAIQLVWDDAQAQLTSGSGGIVPIAGLTLGNTLATWDVQFIRSERSLLFLGRDAVVTIDASTGEILKENYVPWELDLSKPRDR